VEKRRLEKVYGFLEKALKSLIIILMAVMVVLIFVNIICRYFLGAAIAWSEEVSRFILIWIAFLGTILAYVNNEHLGLDLVIRKLPVRLGGVVETIAYLLIAYSLCLLIKGGYALAEHSMSWLSPATGTSYGSVYMVVPICASIMLVQTGYKLIKKLRIVLAGKEEIAC
jgi:TRAP-type C4-dicarboxylate transport system permease small subunit